MPLSTDNRIFVPVARDSKKFKTKYKKRTEVERLNGRLDRDYMFNDHFIRGQEKMELMVDLSFLVMLTMAKGHIKISKKYKKFGCVRKYKKQIERKLVIKQWIEEMEKS